jgi:hypothetical protein
MYGSKKNILTIFKTASRIASKKALLATVNRQATRCWGAIAFQTCSLSALSILASCQQPASQQSYQQSLEDSNAPKVLNTAEVYDPNDLIIVAPRNILPGNSTLIQVAENSKEVIQVRAQDTPGSSLAYRLQNGEDIDKFEIDENTGNLQFKETPDWENPGDANGDNNYMVLWQVASSTGDVRNQFMIVKVVDVKD